MDNQFTNYLTDERYVTSYGFNQKGIVYIENEMDYRFWEEIFNEFHPNKYDFKASFKHDGTRGKDALMELIPSLNKSCILAIDGDFDYICPNHREFGKHFSNPYVIHTHSYSRESVIYSKSQLISLKSKLRRDEQNQIDVISFIEKISHLQYSTLVGYLFLLNTQRQLSNNIDPHKALKSCEFRKLINYDFTLNEDALLCLEQETLKLENEIYQHIDKQSKKFIDFVEELSEKGLNSKTSYRFISGHVLEGNIILPFFTRMKFLMEKSSVRNVSSSEESKKNKANSISSIINYYKTKCGIKTLINNLSICKEDEICSMIRKKVSQIN